MPAPDPLADADVLLEYGRIAMATDLLKAASLREPDRLDIKQRLEEMTTDSLGSDRLREPPKSHIPILIHALVACVLWPCSMALPGYLIFRLTMPLVKMLTLPDSPAVALLAIFSGIALIAVATVTLGLALFSLAWFAYLLRVVNVDAIPDIEAKVQSVIALRRMEPIYGWVKWRVYGLR